MSKKRIGYIIELYYKYRTHTYVYSNDLCEANVFSTREKARENKRMFNGLTYEKTWQVVLDCNNKPVSIIKKVR